MSDSEVRQKVRDFLLKYVKDDELEDDDNIFELGYVNSLFAMQLVLFVEKDFGIAVGRDDLDFRNFNSVDAIVALIGKSGAKA
jgi:acyl carrier protein